MEGGFPASRFTERETEAWRSGRRASGRLRSAPHPSPGAPRLGTRAVARAAGPGAGAGGRDGLPGGARPRPGSWALSARLDNPRDSPGAFPAKPQGGTRPAEGGGWELCVVAFSELNEHWRTEQGREQSSRENLASHLGQTPGLLPELSLGKGEAAECVMSA